MTRIPHEDLIDRRLYRLRGRNIFVGLWWPEVSGFVGVRQKFDSRFLFTELLNDGIMCAGTVTPLGDASVDLPTEIVLNDHHDNVALLDWLEIQVDLDEYRWLNDPANKEYLDSIDNFLATKEAP